MLFTKTNIKLIASVSISYVRLFKLKMQKINIEIIFPFIRLIQNNPVISLKIPHHLKCLNINILPAITHDATNDSIYRVNRGVKHIYTLYNSDKYMKLSFGFCIAAKCKLYPRYITLARCKLYPCARAQPFPS